MKFSKKHAKFLIAARSYLTRAKINEPDINIFNYSIPREEILKISKLSELETEEVAKDLSQAGLIHIYDEQGNFEYCTVASLSFEFLEGFMINAVQT